MKTLTKEVKESMQFFEQEIKKTCKDIKSLKTNKDKTAIVVNKSDKQLYEWAKNG